MVRLSRRAENVLQSEIRAMTYECARVEGINMAQGVCDLAIPSSVIEGAKAAMDAGRNIYTPAEGFVELRDAIAAATQARYGLSVDPDAEIMISSGATGAFHSTAHALLDPGDEVILFEPYYGYHAASLKAMGCRVRYVRLEPPGWRVNWEALGRTINSRTRAVVLSNPSNPTGKVFRRDELERLARFARQHDLVVFSDEIYEHFVYDGLTHIPPASIDALRERTVTISGFSKIFSITGWRLGYAIAPPEVIQAATQYNDLVYVCPPAPLQLGAARGVLELGVEFYREVAREHRVKRDRFCAALRQAGLTPHRPEGAYYVMADISGVPGADDRERALWILERTGVACVPGRAFYHDDAGRNLARFCFAKKSEVLEEACDRIARLALPARSVSEKAMDSKM
ncbi:pyridoxal phosphate-dependent aminotransferase [Thiohalomonas denitrificans]|uniref:Aminotransferase n=1 Tax=Thiohalomonas denitrificans TaxID=415747 RepID=A0A1G5PIJ9_9GAMM|nr:pyridoxal phosphate-dependent aminotransferase [Thiohalomonas denitrificans]SCZ49332.1 aminotransferase [Thiohalomonas denitrificans]